MEISPLKALDLFCGVGGATKGLQLAGFHVTGVDINPQPRYCGDAFYQLDAMKFDLHGYDFIWASPPCQGYSRMSACRPGLALTYPKLIGEIRKRILGLGVPYVIENVSGSRGELINPIMLCMYMFGKKAYRHRYFESNVPLIAPPHPPHKVRCSRGGHWERGEFVSICGNCTPFHMCQVEMCITWVKKQKELAEAIPPFFSYYIAKQILPHVEVGWKSRR